MSEEGLWSQQQAAEWLNVSTRYLRDSNCPRIVLPSTRPHGKPLLRYSPKDVKAWATVRKAG